MTKHQAECLKNFVIWGLITFILGMAYQYSEGRTVFNRSPQSQVETIDDVFNSILDDLGENWESNEERIAREKTTEKDLQSELNSTDNIDIGWATGINLDDEDL